MALIIILLGDSNQLTLKISLSTEIFDIASAICHSMGIVIRWLNTTKKWLNLIHETEVEVCKEYSRDNSSVAIVAIYILLHYCVQSELLTSLEAGVHMLVLLLTA
ncbi:hypothetical protein DITRI_Ditri06bG0147000 [Diplodiscus trichospermus]